MDLQKSKSCLSSKVTLYREVKGKVRYYSLVLYPTLFDEYLLIREFGGVKNKKPTRVMKEYFEYIEDALALLSKLSTEKLKKGYSDKYIESY